VSLWPRALLFDFDGVIVDSEPFTSWRSPKCFAASISSLEDEYYDELNRIRRQGAFNARLEKHGKAA